jgi:2-oxoglutarate dehydrogenase E2 component (dihydrolipoamide succinyltransferase)
MAQFDMIMPKMGESVAEATITKWLKNIGDPIAADESVLEIATDKVDSEVPSPKAGVLVQRLFNEGDVVQVGTVIAVIADSMSDASAAPTPSATPAGQSAPAPAATVQTAASPAPSPTISSGSDRFYSPLVKNIAREEGISQSELDAVSGTGKDGRVTKEDILAYVEKRKQAPVSTAPKIETPSVAPRVDSTPSAASSTPAPAPAKSPAIPVYPGDEIVEMDRMRKLIADHMVKSKATSAHVTSYVEADVTNIVLWREKIKSQFEKREGAKITFTPIFIECLIRAIKDFPMINISVDGSNIIVRKDINIGMAAALPTGNLIVPVIKNADQKNLIGLTKSVNDLADRARQGKLTPDEISGGTYTLTNVGTFGNVMGTPIINQPQVAIMAVGAIRKKPVVIETPQGDTIGIRQMMFLSHSYDHRVVDGALGGRFVRRFADYLEAWDMDRTV